MMPRLQAEEQTVRITAGRVAAGAGDDQGRRIIQDYDRALERQREGLPAPTATPKRDRFARAAMLGIRIGRAEAKGK